MDVALDTQGWSPFVDVEGNAQGDIDVTLKRLDGSIALASVTDTDGTLPAALPHGRYTLTVGGVDRVVDVVSAQPFGWVGVQEFGAVASPIGAPVDVTAEVQAAIDYVVAQGGGTVYFPEGCWSIGGVTIPNEVPVRLKGAGMVMRMDGQYIGGTWLHRHPGSTDTLILAGDSTLGSGSRCWVELTDFSLWGGGAAYRGIDIHNGQNAWLDRVRISDCLHNGLRCRGMFNSAMGQLWVHACGSPTEAAVLFDSPTVNNAGCETVQITNLEIEGSNGIDLKFSGYFDDPNTPTITAPSHDICIANLKAEGATALAAALPSVHFDYAQDVRIMNARIYSAIKTVALVLQDHPFGSGELNLIANSTLVAAGGNPTHIINNDKGPLSLSNVVANGATTAALRIGNQTANAGKVRWAAFTTNGAKLVDDLLGLPSVASAATVTLPVNEEVIKVTGTADITSITAGHAKRRVTLIFTGGATGTGLTVGGNLKIGANFVYTADDVIELVSDGTSWYRVGPGSAN